MSNIQTLHIYYRLQVHMKPGKKKSFNYNYNCSGSLNVLRIRIVCADSQTCLEWGIHHVVEEEEEDRWEDRLVGIIINNHRLTDPNKNRAQSYHNLDRPLALLIAVDSFSPVFHNHFCCCWLQPPATSVLFPPHTAPYFSLCYGQSSIDNLQISTRSTKNRLRFPNTFRDSALII